MPRMAFLKEVEAEPKPVPYKTLKSIFLFQNRTGSGMWLSHSSESTLIPQLWPFLERFIFSL